jgi:hypothetical protein
MHIHRIHATSSRSQRFMGYDKTNLYAWWRVIGDTFAICLALSACIPSAQAQSLSCAPDAARLHGVNHWVLSAILWQESRWKADAIRSNRNGSTDYGIAQINSVHLPELKAYRISEDDLMDACVGTYVAAWHLRKQIVRYGNTWFAVGAYHSVTPALNKQYAKTVCKVIAHWHNAGSDRTLAIDCQNIKTSQHISSKPHKKPASE